MRLALAQAGLGALGRADVARDPRDAGERAGRVPHRRDRDGEVDHPAVAALAAGFEMVDPLAAPDALADGERLVARAFGLERRDVAADDLAGRIAEHRLGPRFQSVTIPSSVSPMMASSEKARIAASRLAAASKARPSRAASSSPAAPPPAAGPAHSRSRRPRASPRPRFSANSTSAGRRRRGQRRGDAGTLGVLDQAQEGGVAERPGGAPQKARGGGVEREGARARVKAPASGADRLERGGRAAKFRLRRSAAPTLHSDLILSPLPRRSPRRRTRVTEARLRQIKRFRLPGQAVCDKSPTPSKRPGDMSDAMCYTARRRPPPRGRP